MNVVHMCIMCELNFLKEQLKFKKKLWLLFKKTCSETQANTKETSSSFLSKGKI